MTTSSRIRRITPVIAILAVTLLATGAWAISGAGAGSTEAAGINADTVDNHHAGPSGGTAAQRANRVLWADTHGKLGARALPFNALDRRYLSDREDTFIYVPGSLLRFHWDDGNVASARFNLTSQAIVRKEGSAGSIYVDIPVQLAAQQSGRWGKLVNMRLYYKVDNPASYIDTVGIYKINGTGGHITLANNGTDGKSTTWNSLFVSCDVPECQLSWPTGGFVTVDIELNFGGTGDAHDITIGGVLMRVSHDG